MSKLTPQARDHFPAWKETATYVMSLSDKGLAAFSAEKRQFLLTSLAQIGAKKLDRHTTVQMAMKRLLLATPYPEDIALLDATKTHVFHKRWVNERDTYVKHQHEIPIEQALIFIGNAAADSLGLFDIFGDNLRISTHFSSFGAFNSALGKSDFLPFMGVHTEFTETGSLQILVLLNEDHYVWHLELFTSDDFNSFASAMWHELSHVEQKYFGQNLSIADPFYQTLQNQYELLGPYLKYYDVYRALLNERQSYYREHLFEAHLEGVLPVNEANWTSESYKNRSKAIRNPEDLDRIYLRGNHQSR